MDRVTPIRNKGSGFLAGLRSKAATWIVGALSLTSREGWRDEESDAGEEVNGDVLLSISTAWGCCNLHAGVLGTLPCHVYRPKRGGLPGEVEIATDHWLEQLLENGPNLDQTDVDFWEFVAFSMEMRGNAYAEKRRLSPGGSVVALQPLRPDWINVRRSRQDGRLKYRFPGEDGVERELDQDDVWHIRGPGGSPLGGLSTISFGRHAFGLARAAERTAGRTFRNGIRASMALVFKNWMKPDQRQAIEDRLVAKHASAMNAGRPLVLEGGADYKAISWSPEDAQVLQSRGFSVEEVCRWFGVHPIMVGHSKDVTAWGSGISELVQGFVKFALRRRVKRIESSAKKFLLTALERAAGYYLRFDMEGLLRGDPEARARFYQIMAQCGFYSIDEVRGFEGMAPLPDGIGAIPRMQAQNVPLGIRLESGELVAMPQAPAPAPAPKPALPKPQAEAA